MRNTILHFQPIRTWPQSFPVMLWQQWVIAGFDHDPTHAEIDLSEKTDFQTCFNQCHPQLSLAELARIYKNWSGQSKFIESAKLDWPLFFKKYGLNYNHQLVKTLLALTRTPDSFQNWVAEKNLSLKDLAPLLSAQKLAPLHPVFQKLTELNPSKSDGVKILEYATELYLMNNKNNLALESKSARHWLEGLYQKRHPLSSRQNAEQNLKIKKLPWPSQIQGRWKRFGDKAGLDIHFMATSKEDFNKKLNGLLHLKDKMEHAEDLWKS